MHEDVGIRLEDDWEKVDSEAMVVDAGTCKHDAG